MDETQKRRVSIFITGVLIGSVLSVLLFYVWQGSQTETVVETADVVVATCDIKTGESLSADCTKIRTGVATHFLPPGVMLAKDLPMHMGREFATDIEKGNAIRIDDLVVVD